MRSTDPSIAIVVIGRNEGPRLHDCLQSAFQACSKVVYADSASTDGSVELASSMGAHVVCVEPSLPMNAARGRNAGFDVVKARFPDCEFVQFMDGDCLLAEGWIRLALEFLKSHPRAAVACGRRYEAHPEASFYNRLADEEWNTAVGLAQSCGGDALMRVSALDEVGAFNPLLMASEEPELSARLRERGWQIWRLDAPMTQHDARMLSFRQWWRRTTRSGFGYAQAWLATRHLARPVNHKLLRSALFWVIGVPLAVLVFAFVTHSAVVLFFLPLVYGVQIVRVAVRRSDLSINGLRSSSMLMLAKVPELLGAARVLLWRQKSAMIEYKNGGGTPSRKSS